MVQKIVDIPIIKSGEKYRSQEGVIAIKDGIKSKKNDAKYQHLQKPSWLKVKVSTNEKFNSVKGLVAKHKLSTVCEEAKCPNISECWSHGTATFMIMGSICTRACKFCSVDTGNPHGFLDLDEPNKVASSVEVMGLRYVVLTSVDRDDLKDGGASHFAATVKAIKNQMPQVKVEALTPDFQGKECDIRTVIDSGIDVFAQNVETVERLTHIVRDKRAGYNRTLDVLAYAKNYKKNILTKTSLMLGLGETEEELLQAMNDLRAKEVDILTLGQYLQPTKNHLPVIKYISPDDFVKYRKIGLEKGFMEVAAGPMVRSSYRADRIFTDENLGLEK